jgi:hypothetical protein
MQVLYTQADGSKLIYEREDGELVFGYVIRPDGKQYPTKPVESILARGYWEVAEEVIKHQEHDQSSHGNWASAGTPIPVNPDSFVEDVFPKDFYTQLTDEEITAVANYQLTGYLAINRFLRDSTYKNPGGSETSAENMPKIIEAVDSAIVKAGEVVPDGSAVFRVVDIGIFEEMEVGSMITDKGYTSTTMRDLSKMDSAEYKRYEDAGKSIVRIDLGDKKSGLAVNSIHEDTNKVGLNFLEEREFLLPRGTQFEYAGYDEENQVHVLRRTK